MFRLERIGGGEAGAPPRLLQRHRFLSELNSAPMSTSAAVVLPAIVEATVRTAEPDMAPRIWLIRCGGICQVVFGSMCVNPMCEEGLGAGKG